MIKTNIGCNGLVIKDNKLLLGLRKNCKGEGTYGLPGGHLEQGERLVDGVKRELYEECGVRALRLRFSSIVDERLPSEMYIQVNFVVSEYEGTITCVEKDKCAGWEWFDINSLPHNIFPPHIPIITVYKQNIAYLQ